MLESPAAAAPAAAPGAADALRRELSGLRLMALHSRALAEGVSGSAADDAMEASDPKAELIKLIVAKSAGPAPVVQSDGLRAEGRRRLAEATGRLAGPREALVGLFGEGYV